VVEVPETLVRIHPEWRGHSYFVVHDEIIIVDPEHKVVATVPVGRSSAQLNQRSSINLSWEQIRELQIVLRDKGFDIGEPDGVMGRITGIPAAREIEKTSPRPQVRAAVIPGPIAIATTEIATGATGLPDKDVTSF
jgi:hypothetical protein